MILLCIAVHSFGTAVHYLESRSRIWAACRAWAWPPSESWWTAAGYLGSETWLSWAVLPWRLQCPGSPAGDTWCGSGKGPQTLQTGRSTTFTRVIRYVFHWRAAGDTWCGSDKGPQTLQTGCSTTFTRVTRYVFHWRDEHNSQCES